MDITQAAAFFNSDAALKNADFLLAIMHIAKRYFRCGKPQSSSSVGAIQHCSPQLAEEHLLIMWIPIIKAKFFLKESRWYVCLH